MTNREWTLLTIAAAAGKPVQPVQLQKALFLLGRNLTADKLGIDHFYSFVPYDFGPFCAEIYADAEQLEAEGFVAITRPPESRFKTYRITDPGSRRADEIRSRLPNSTSDYLKRVVSFTQMLSFNQLVTAIYRAYPDTKVNSVFQELE